MAITIHDVLQTQLNFKPCENFDFEYLLSEFVFLEYDTDARMSKEYSHRMSSATFFQISEELEYSVQYEVYAFDGIPFCWSDHWEFTEYHFFNFDVVKTLVQIVMQMNFENYELDETIPDNPVKFLIHDNNVAFTIHYEPDYGYIYLDHYGISKHDAFYNDQKVNVIETVSRLQKLGEPYKVKVINENNEEIIALLKHIIFVCKD